MLWTELNPIFENKTKKKKKGRKQTKHLWNGNDASSISKSADP